MNLLDTANGQRQRRTDLLAVPQFALEGSGEPDRMTIVPVGQMIPIAEQGETEPPRTPQPVEPPELKPVGEFQPIEPMGEFQPMDITERDQKRIQLRQEQAEAAKVPVLSEQNAMNWLAALGDYVVGPASRPIATLQKGVAAAGEMTGLLTPEQHQAATLSIEQPPRIASVPQQQGIPGQVAAGAINAGIDFANMVTDPDALAQLGVAGVPSAMQKRLLVAFGAGMAMHAPEQLNSAANAFRTGNPQEGVRNAIGGVGGTMLSALVTRAGLNKPGIVDATPEFKPLPSPDLIARNNMAPGTMRPQEIRGQEWLPEPPPDYVYVREPVFNEAGQVVDVRPQLKPKIREVVIEEPSMIVAQERVGQPREDAGGRLAGFNKTAEEKIAERPEPPPSPGVVVRGEGEPAPAVGRQGYAEPIGPIFERATGEMMGPPAHAVGRQGYEEPIGPINVRSGEMQGPPAPVKPKGIMQMMSELAGNIGASINDYTKRATREELLRDYQLSSKLLDEVNSEIEFRRKESGNEKELFPIRYNADGIRASIEHALMVRNMVEPAPAVGRQGYAEPIGPFNERATGEQFGPPERQRAPSPVVEEVPSKALSPTRAPVGSSPEVPDSGSKGVGEKPFPTVRKSRKVAAEKPAPAPEVPESGSKGVRERQKSAGHVAFVETDTSMGGRPDVTEYYVKGRTLHWGNAERPVGKSGVRKSSYTADLKGGKLNVTGESVEEFIARKKREHDAFMEQANAQIRRFGEQREQEAEAQRQEWANRNAPKPGLISGTKAEAWAERTIQQSKKRLHAGIDPELMVAYAIDGAALLERGVRKWAEWSSRMLAKHGPAIRPHLQRLWQEAQATFNSAQRDQFKERKLAQRGARSASVAPEHRQRLRTSTESLYEPQEHADVRERVEGMSNDDLARVPMMQEAGPQNVWAAAQLELYNRLRNAGRLDEAWGVFENLMRTGTTMGQAIAQLKMLRSATPEGVMYVINRRLQKEGFDPLRPAAQADILRKAERNIRDHADLRTVENEWRADPSEANTQRVDQARRQAVESEVDLQQYIQSVLPRNGWNLATTMLKGNLMVPMSLAANVAGNAVNLTARGLLRNWEAIADTVQAALFRTERTATVAPIRGTIEALRAAMASLPEAGRIMKRGTADPAIDPLEVRRQPHPLQAWKELLARDASETMPRRGGRVATGQKWLALMEGSPMMMNATAFLRALSATDLPFRQAARARVIVSELKLLDLNRQARRRALERNRDRSDAENIELAALRSQEAIYNARNARLATVAPEVFFDAPALERIEQKSSEAVYQQRNPVSNVIGRMASGASPAAKFWGSTLVPFVKTPSNVIGEWLSWTPPVAAANLLGRAPFTRNGQLARNAAGKLIIGSMMGTAAVWLSKNGLLSPTDIGPTVQSKERELQREVMPPGSINVTGLKRVLKGEQGFWQPGDEVRSVVRWGGILGTLALIVADTMRWQEKQPQPPGPVEAAGIGAAQSAFLATSYGVQQSFLKGTASLIKALEDPNKVDAWLAEYAGTVGSVALPNTLGATARTLREAKPELRGDAWHERLEGKLRDRLGAFGLTKDLPVKRDLWGRPIPETPPGKNPWVYQIFDLSKGQEVPNDPLLLHVYNLYRGTADLRVIPSPPDQSLSLQGQQFVLDRHQQSDLAEIVGGLRYRLGNKLVGNSQFLSATTSAQVEMMSSVWELANQAGTLQYLMRHGRELERKQKPAGFALPK